MLALASVSPKIINALAADKIDLATAQAFTLTDDHKRQERVLRRARSAHEVRSLLTETKVTTGHRLFRFVGMDEYQAAGGTLTGDLFAKEGEDYADDPQLVQQLADEKLDGLAAETEAEGWGEVMACESTPYDSYKWHRLYPDATRRTLNPEEKAEVAKHQAARDALVAEIWVGLDVGMKSTAVCVLDGDGKVVHQCAMKTHPTEIGRYLAKNFTSNVAVVGMETGAMSVHLSGGLRRLGYQVAVMDALQVHRVLSLKRNKTDTNDARGIAEITRTGRDYLTEVYVKSAACYEVRAQLIMRHRLVQQRVANENMIRGLLRVYGGQVEAGAKSAATYRTRVVEQLMQIQDRDGINMCPRIVPVLDLCERLQADADPQAASMIPTRICFTTGPARQPDRHATVRSRHGAWSAFQPVIASAERRHHGSHRACTVPVPPAGLQRDVDAGSCDLRSMSRVRRTGGRPLPTTEWS